ncbi:MAG: glycerol-3-phosphate dehydrogenase [Calditrichaeota bacterium]|nr:glycerol-3-phosphate dehydrogenase [Calditrichota bacterium]
MKEFWRWGDPETVYSVKKRPLFFPFLKEVLNINDKADAFIPGWKESEIKHSIITDEQFKELQSILGVTNIDTGLQSRLIHSFGKSYHDLLKIKLGITDHITDAVIFPESEQQITAVLKWSVQNKFAVVPYAGGTSVVGGVGAYKDPSQKGILTLSMARFNQIIEIDKDGLFVDVRAGVFGPDLEKALVEHELTLGHFPESFEFSTVGGWIATRSAGQQSTLYGKIEDMVEALKIVTTDAIIDISSGPAAANGPDLKQLVIGSEGTFGIITQARLKLKPHPAKKIYRTWLVDSFDNGKNLLKEVMQSEVKPATLRLSDAEETRFILSLREKSKTGLTFALQDRILSRAEKNGFKSGTMAFLLLGFEGDRTQVNDQLKYFEKIIRSYKTFSLGKSPAESWLKHRYQNPYLRDVLLDYNIMVDTLETSAEWKDISNIYEKTKTVIETTFRKLNIKGIVTAHLSHLYPHGSSIYFIILAAVKPDEALHCWRQIKTNATNCILENNGTVSHHHGVGRDHRRWLEKDIGTESLKVLRSLKKHFDPDNILNPGKLLPDPTSDIFIQSGKRLRNNAIEFSYKKRLEFINQLKSRSLDILVIGGGITGAGILRDAAIRGFKAGLIEKDDFASGTSSKSSKLVHGGFRYLKNLEFGLVHEALMERKTLMDIAPHLVHPIQCLLPVYKNASVPGWMIQIGMLLYDGLSFTKRIGLHKLIAVEDIHEREPLLRKEGLEKVFMYYDSRADDTRLVMANIQSAVQHDALAVNYVKAVDVVKEDGKITGVMVKDQISGETFAIRSKVVANASGPWCDVLRDNLLGQKNKRIRTTKGIHLLVQRKDLNIERTMILSAPNDDRPIFVIPWRNYVILGTTDTDFNGDPDWVDITEDDVDYLLEAYNYYFPAAKLNRQKIVSAYSGLRPLTFEEGKSAGEVTREYQIFETPENFFSIIGGKLTTYRTMAEELTDRLAENLEEKYSIKAKNNKCITDKVPLYGGDIDDFAAFREKWFLSLTETYKFEQDIAENFIEAYGNRLPDLLEIIDQTDLGRERIISSLPYVWGEITYAINHEMAMSLDDIMLRRLHLFSLDKKQGWDAHRVIAERMASVLGWSDQEKESQIKRYKEKIALVQDFKKADPENR